MKFRDTPIFHLLFAVALGAAATGCVTDSGHPAMPGAIADFQQYLITADSAWLAGTGTFMADSALRFTPEGKVPVTITPGAPLGGRFGYSSSQPLVDMLYRIEAATPLPEAVTLYTMLDAWGCPLPADSLGALLLSRVANGYLAPVENKRYSWPVVNDEPEWSLGAMEVAMADGNASAYRRLRQPAANMASTASAVMWNSRNALYESVPAYLGAEDAGMPAWMTPTDLFQTLTLTHNVAWYGTARSAEALDAHHGVTSASLLPVGTDSLQRRIRTMFWLPNRGYLSGMLYGSPVTPLQLEGTDNLAQALAIVTGAASEAMSQSIIRRTPLTPEGVTGFYPLLTPADNHRKAVAVMRQTLWAVACCRGDNHTAVSRAVAGTLCKRLNELADIAAGRAREQGLRPVTTLIIRCLAGMQFAPDGIFFAPNIPESLPGEKHLTGLVYRDAVLDIDITGTGTAITTFTIDGRNADPFFPAVMTGHHRIALTLGGPPADRGRVTPLSGDVPVMPGAPDVTWTSERDARITPAPPVSGNMAAATTSMVYLNAVPEEEIYRSTYTLYEAQQLTTVQFVPVDASSVAGFSGAPYTYLPRDRRLIIYATDITKGGTRIIQDKKASARFVELNRYKNRTVRFSVNSETRCRALLDLRYINGLGIVNSHRRTAVRALRVNGADAGYLIFPQLSSAWWNRDLGDNWQQLTAWSNALPVELEPGVNTIEIRYRQLSPVYIDPQSNTILVELIRLMPLGAGADAGKPLLSFINSNLHSLNNPRNQKQ